MGDGGIYILHTPFDSKGDRFEFRVMHLYDIKEIWHKNEDKTVNYDEVAGEALQRIFGSTKAYLDKSDADECANKLYYRLELSDPSLIKDGINAVHLCEPFSFYVKSTVARVKKARKPGKSTKTPTKRIKTNEGKEKKGK